MTIRTTVLSLSLVGVVLLAVHNLPARVQQDTIDVTNPRPLAEAIRIFQERFGRMVTYEDPPYAYKEDIVDVTDEVRNPAAPVSSHRVYGPRGGRFVFTFDRPSDDTSDDAMAAHVERLIATFNVSGYPGQFRLTQTGRRVHVTPTSVRRADGVSVSLLSVLDVRVSFNPQKGRSTFDLLNALFVQVRSLTGQRIALGSCPANLLMQTRMENGTTDELARDVLIRALDESGRDMSWRLLYSVDLQKYALNLTIVGKK